MKCPLAVLTISAWLLLSAAPALGIVASGVPADFTGYWAGDNWSFPDVHVYRWNYASGVAVGKYWLLTVGHVSGWVGEQWNLDGTVRTVTQVLTPPPDSGQTLPPDLALIRFDQPFSGWEHLDNHTYSAADPRTPMIMIGYGYSGWAGRYTAVVDTTSPQIKRWGTNAFDSYTRSNVGSFSSTTFTMWYNNTDTHPDTEYEAAFAEGDSGGGTFVKVGNQWRLAGINAYVAPSLLFPNLSFAVDVPSYYRWLTTSMTVPGDTNFDMTVDFADYQRLEVNFGVTAGANWEMGDFNDDHKVDFADYQALETHFAESVPEPATAGLIPGGLALLALRRRR